MGYWGTFLYSLLLSPLIGLIIALVSSDKSQIRIKKCGHCGFVDKTGAQFCPGCGKDNIGKTQDDYKQLASNPEYINGLEEEKRGREEKIRKRKKKDKRDFIILGIVIIILIAIVYIIRLNRG